VSQALRERAIFDLNDMGVTEVTGSVLIANKAGCESSRAVGFRPTQLLGTLDIAEQVDRISGHRSAEGRCLYGYTDGFYTEGECPLCGRNDKGESNEVS
jgi:hypothetical protein